MIRRHGHSAGASHAHPSQEDAATLAREGARAAGAGDAADAMDGTVWWGPQPLAAGEAGCWRVGALRLWAQRRPGEWRFAWQRDAPAGAVPGGAEGAVEVRCPLPPGELADGELPAPAESLRVAVGAGDAAALHLLPLLPDRPLVARPSRPFRVVAGDDVTLFVSTPVWVRASAGDRLLCELPSRLLADTWIGASTLHGELGYAVRDAVRLAGEPRESGPHSAPTHLAPTHLAPTHLASTHLAPTHLASTRVVLRNAAGAALLVERLTLPAPQLALWWQPGRGLWTPDVEVRRREDGAVVDLELGEGPPAAAPEAHLVSGARSPQPRANLVSALEALFG